MRCFNQIVSIAVQTAADVFPNGVMRAAGLFVIPGALAGCVKIPISAQQDLSRPNMVFESQGAFASRPALFTQTEPGSAVSSGGQSAGCTACR